MGEAKRKTYTAAFKAKVGLEAIRGVKTVNEIGQAYGVHPVQVGQWKREIQTQAETLFTTKRGPKPDGPRLRLQSYKVEATTSLTQGG
jgi:transposase